MPRTVAGISLSGPFWTASPEPKRSPTRNAGASSARERKVDGAPTLRGLVSTEHGWTTALEAKCPEPEVGRNVERVVGSPNRRLCVCRHVVDREERIVCAELRHGLNCGPVTCRVWVDGTVASGGISQHVEQVSDFDHRQRAIQKQPTVARFAGHGGRRSFEEVGDDLLVVDDRSSGELSQVVNGSCPGHSPRPRTLRTLPLALNARPCRTVGGAGESAPIASSTWIRSARSVS